MNIKISENAEGKAIIYGYIEHPTTKNLYMAMRYSCLVAINFGISEQEFLHHVETQFKAPLIFNPQKTEAALEQVKNYLDGKVFDFSIPTEISFLTDFQKRVLQTTQQIPRGEVRTYKAIAQKIGRPKATQAVGQALGRNPIPIVIPCHRVISSNGSLGGYSGGGGLKTKIELLQLEGVQLPGL